MSAFGLFRRRFLLAAVSEMPPHDVRWLDVGDICERHGILFSAEPAAIAAELHLIQDEGFGLAEISDGSLQFRFSPKGYAEACRLRDKGIFYFLRDFSRSDWISFGAFVVSIIALFKKA